MTIDNILNWAQLRLNKTSPSANLDAEILLSFILKKDKIFLYSHPENKLTSTQLIKFKKIIDRRLQGEPIAYLTGTKEFYNLNFIVNKYVLIPRPETEIIVAEILKNRKIKTIADIGTGSGCIATALAKNNSKLKIYASDISASAINIARKNAINNKINKQITFKKGDLLKPFKNIKLDAIVANLPYLDIKHKNLLNSSETVGLKFEPTIALYAGKDGLDSYRQLFKQIKQLKHTPNFIYLEIGHLQTIKIKKIIKTNLPSVKINIKKDLAGLNRLIIIKII